MKTRTVRDTSVEPSDTTTAVQPVRAKKTHTVVARTGSHNLQESVENEEKGPGPSKRYVALKGWTESALLSKSR